MKKILIFVLLLAVTTGSLCYAAAAKWTLITETNHTALYLDTDSIASATIKGADIKKFKVKLIFKPLNNYQFNWIYVDLNTKNWLVVHEDKYDPQGKLTANNDYSPEGQWNSYEEDALWKPVLDKILAN